MVGETTIQKRNPLLPLRHVQRDFFVCDIFDAVPKGDMASMAHPIFSLSTKPDTRIRRYETTSGESYIEITPSVKGLATVHDRDVLIYCISQIMAALNEGKQIHRTMRFKAYDLLVATNRPTGGESYKRLKESLERLKGTVIVTNVTTNTEEQLDGFSLIDGFKVIRESRDGRMLDLEITLSDWVFNAIAGQEVLTLNRQYFQLRKPIERRLYELARKHCGKQKEWKIGLEKLQAKTGSNSSTKEFKRLVKTICADDEKHGHMPDYIFNLMGDMLHVTPKDTFTEKYGTHRAQDAITGQYIIPLKPETLERAREVAPAWDIHMLVSEWRTYSAQQKTPPKNPDKAFLGFCQKWFEKRGRP
ncbi:MAG: replication initiator protein A [Proteobacteria bacterium]|nr:replication initiator protein A [Pseudomonadota bacterium]